MYRKFDERFSGIYIRLTLWIVISVPKIQIANKNEVKSLIPIKRLECVFFYQMSPLVFCENIFVVHIKTWTLFKFIDNYLILK